MPTHSPGTLVRARGREWIVLSGSDTDTLHVRPLSGSEDDQTWIHLPLEAEPVTEATFPPPNPAQKAGHEGALLLRDALLLSLRRGAGPFRGFGQIAVEPRAYQLVPLLMALKMDPIRLLIADDVGVGKTIEAALIAREMLDRGEIDRMTVLCPPHLVDQWVTELETRFHIRAVAITAAGVSRLERDLSPSDSVFLAYPYTVVSLDYIKSDTRRADFLRVCPPFVIVDEAHSCASAGRGRHLRYGLLHELSQSKDRHMVLLTATPHSGDEPAFFRLLALLDPALGGLEQATGDERDRLRDLLARHFVQRRRPDIAEWKEGKLFPKREIKEITYQLTGEWDRFFQAVLDYCAAVVDSAEGDERRKRLSFWTTLALMRCVASSPAAALGALRTRAGLSDEADDEYLEDRIFDGRADALPDDDVEPPVANDDPALTKLIETAEKLNTGSGDPKLKLLTDHLGQLIKEGFSPVVFCRYIATAHYLGKHLANKFPGVTVDVVTGELTSDERKEKVARLGEAEKPLLFATDCLSEGINLQEWFDAVVHYDLSWNPTRHEQREGRVDRFGQTSDVVRATLMYGANNPVDGAVLEVIVRKAAKIREELGVPVPLPDDGHSLTQALMKAVLLRHRQAPKQIAFNFADMVEAKAVDKNWQDAAEKAKRNRTLFAQRRLKPYEVLPEWHKTLTAVGGREDVERFTGRSLARLGAGLEKLRRGFKIPLGALPEDVRERLALEGFEKSLLVDFTSPPAPRCRAIHRSHPVVAILAETLLERTLAANGLETTQDPSILGRVGCWHAPNVQAPTTITLLRLRHQLVTTRAGQAQTILVEEAAALAWCGGAKSVEGTEALTLLVPAPVGDPPAPVRARFASRALDELATRQADLEAYALRRAQALLEDHRRVRDASAARGSHAVKALLPPDVIGLFVLLPPVENV